MLLNPPQVKMWVAIKLHFFICTVHMRLIFNSSNPHPQINNNESEIIFDGLSAYIFIW
jgi:hypothetical protein